jgi:putative sterol carrier protein
VSGAETPARARDIIRSLEQRLLADEVPGGYACTVHLDIAGDGGGQFTVQVADGRCTVRDGLHGEADAGMRSSDRTYEDVALGRKRVEVAIMTGKIRVKNLPVMARFTKLFRRLPRE